MSNGQSWFSWFSFPFFAPLSGPVNQDIAPVYQGIPEIETAVIREVGSFGTQLGIISKAVLELADHIKSSDTHALTKSNAADKPSELEKLRDLVDQVDRIKARYKDAAKADVQRALTRLKAIDPEAHEELVNTRRP